MSQVTVSKMLAGFDSVQGKTTVLDHWWLVHTGEPSRIKM